MEYNERSYRRKLLKDYLIGFELSFLETDLFIKADSDLTAIAGASVERYRTIIESYIKLHPDFLTSLAPLAYDPQAPRIIREMLATTSTCKVGPMASVAGAMAQFVALDLLQETRNVIIENGGDIFLKTDREVLIGLFAGDSPWSGRLALRTGGAGMTTGVCTSSATVGPSLSLGKANAVTIKARTSTLADAAATAIGNRVVRKEDIRSALDFGQSIKGVSGILIVLNDQLGVWGDMELVETSM
ncbi:MAG: UPF0280 family protein [Smithellaceae bacterium]|nr:UPF0280 family protein [Smithellaceae bacterium]